MKLFLEVIEHFLDVVALLVRCRLLGRSHLNEIRFSHLRLDAEVDLRRIPEQFLLQRDFGEVVLWVEHIESFGTRETAWMLSL